MKKKRKPPITPGVYYIEKDDKLWVVNEIRKDSNDGRMYANFEDEEGFYFDVWVMHPERSQLIRIGDE